jgi:YVTN family beta-propeller protein
LDVGGTATVTDSCRKAFGLLVCLLVLAACPGKGLTFDLFRGPRGGRLVVYLHGPDTVTADVTFTVDSVSAVDDRGVRVPFVTEPRLLETRALVGRQVLLGEAALPEGQYRGLHFTFSEAFIKRGVRKADLAYPEEGWMLEAPFKVGARDSATLFLTWDPARSLEMGFFFSPKVTAEREARQIRQLLVYVANEGSDTVSVLNRQTGRIVDTLAVPRGPRGMAASLNSENLYVVSTEAGRLTHFRTRSNERLLEFRFQLGSEPQDVAVSPDSSRVFVTLLQLDKLVILDANSLNRLEEVDVGDGPMGVIVEPSGRKVYVANSRSNSVSVVSALTGDVLSTVSVEPNPRRLAITPDGREVLVTGYDSTFITAISVTTNQITRRLNSDRWIADIVVDSRLNRYYMVQDRTNNLLFYEPNSQLPLQTISVGPHPHRVGLDPDLRTIFVVSREAKTLTLVDRITGMVEGVVEVGRSPHDVVVVEVP